MKDMTNKKGETMPIHEGVKGEFELVDHCLIIKLGEDLDHHNAIYLRERADKIIMNRNVRNIIFDFSEIDFMDSSGIGAIIGRYKKVDSIGGRVFVTGVSKNIDRILKISGLYKIINKYDRVQDALDAVDAVDNERNKKDKKNK